MIALLVFEDLKEIKQMHRWGMQLVDILISPSESYTRVTGVEPKGLDQEIRKELQQIMEERQGKLQSKQ